MIPNHNVHKPAYNFLNKGAGTTSLRAQFLFDFFALMTISFIYGTFFLVGHLLASSYAKSRTGFNFIFSALGVVFLFVFFATPFLAIFVSNLRFLQNMPNYT